MFGALSIPGRWLASLSLSLLTGCSLFAPPEKWLPAQRWIEVRTDNFTLTSDATVKRTVEIAESLELFRNVVMRTTSVTDTSSSVPTHVYVFRNSATFSALAGGVSKDAIGYFASRTSGNYAVIQANALRGADVAQHEYVHFLLRNSSFAYPHWYDEGLAEMLSTVGTDEGFVHLGRPPSNAAWLVHSNTLPLSKVVMARNTTKWRSSPRAKFYAKSWLFTHYLHFEKERHQQLLRFLDLWHSGQPTEQAFEEAFGVGFEEMDRLLGRYLEETKYVRFGRDSFTTEAKTAVHTLRTPEAMRRLGDLLVALGDEESYRLALSLFRRAIAEDPGHARSHAGVGWCMTWLEEGEGAEASLSRAVELDPDDALIELAYAAHLVDRASAEELDSTEVSRLQAEALAHYRRCLVIDPKMPACHLGLGGVLARRGENRAAAESFVVARALLPSNSEVALAVGAFYVEVGLEDQARQVLEGVVHRAHSGEYASIARALLDQLGDSPPERRSRQRREGQQLRPQQ